MGLPGGQFVSLTVWEQWRAFLAVSGHLDSAGGCSSLCPLWGASLGPRSLISSGSHSACCQGPRSLFIYMSCLLSLKEISSEPGGKGWLSSPGLFVCIGGHLASHTHGSGWRPASPARVLNAGKGTCRCKAPSASH